MKVFFRTDASLQIGSGHVMRCLTLAHTLRERGADCRFVCRAHEGNMLERIRHEGFKVMAYTNDDLVTALRLEDAGCVAVMPLASPIGSGLGVVNPYFIREIKRRLEVPVIVDAGVGTASDACITMEQGVDGVLMNTAFAAAKDPVRMAHAMRCATISGRLAFLAGRMTSHEIAVPSSPKAGMLD